MTDLEYNTQRKSIPLPEYGRNLQKMVTKVVNMKDREKRTRYAHQIIEIMIQINPTAKDSPELRHKLWDHLHIMSDFKLDIDSPFPLPDKEVLKTQPEQLSYPDDNLKYNYYGRIIQNIIDVRKDKGMVKFVFNDHFWGIQLDGATGKLLQIERRNSDMIENIHDGSILDHYLGTTGEPIKVVYTTIMGLGLLIFTITGFWLWYGPKRM
jgi:hypothetical protein